jgi:hypothetical protein
MLLYIFAAIGALTFIAVVLVLILMFFGWLGQSVAYVVRPDEIQRYLASWGRAIADGGNIQVGQPDTDRAVTFVKRQYKKIGDRLVFRLRNADEARPHFKQVTSALARAGIPFEVERTPTGRTRAIVIPFAVDDPLMPSAAAHSARVALAAMGSPADGLFEMKCTGSHRQDYLRGSVEVIPWTRGYRAGFQVGRLVDRLWRARG